MYHVATSTLSQRKLHNFGSLHLFVVVKSSSLEYTQKIVDNNFVSEWCFTYQQTVSYLPVGRNLVRCAPFDPRESNRNTHYHILFCFENT